MRTALALLVLLAPIDARAQLIATSFDELPTTLQQGETIELTTAAGDTLETSWTCRHPETDRRTRRVHFGYRFHRRYA